ncbi:AraC family transcriptional regulator [Sinanaerobacter sp. ZZT-01]|uniref:AraC family transcriptional regulator n=1 Tax=Sinanaerobacter sp. ZZT-01 TaxID=3111540 RepID=UPI002D79621B|nr:AraC family transcriptional regulator [Sinanaerobacter sp. ZZT-01]WRR93033.1 AraC family transcriptional regulator [Sinanaerobacter sp. ZZT-01]
MEWIERLNNAVQYIEEHLTEPIDYNQTAKIACCSVYHFQRMFSYIADVPLSEYIRRRRMTMAAVDLQSGEEKVIDVAVKYGYDSPTAFNRAFQSVHGIAPSQAKKGGVILKAFPPISFNITIKGDVEMNYRIEKKEAFRIIGVSRPLCHEIEENFKVVPEMWQKAAMDGTIEKMVPMMKEEIRGILGISACNEQEEWKYFIAIASDAKVEAPLEEYIVPATTWAIFEGEGPMPHSIQEMEKRIVMEWLPNSGYEYGNAPDIEVYLNPDPQNSKFEIWVPVVKKK